MIINLPYILVVPLAWLFAGSLKFLINSIKVRRFAFKKIGYGGLPSNHTAMVTSVVSLVAFKEGFNHPSFSVALALTVIVMLDAHSLRGQIGKHAKIINKMKLETEVYDLRESVGHTKVEIFFGFLVGVFTACFLQFIQ